MYGEDDRDQATLVDELSRNVSQFFLKKSVAWDIFAADIYPSTYLMSFDKDPLKEKKCQIAEIVQYTCDLEQLENGQSQVHCFPIPRIFRM